MARDISLDNLDLPNLTAEEIMALGNRRWRMVCHTCGHKLPPMAVGSIRCCDRPDWHVHNLKVPCDRCRESAAR